MFLKIIIKLAIYCILISVISFIASKTKNIDDEIKLNKKGEQFYDRKFLSKIYFGVAIAFSIVFIVAFSFPSNVVGITKAILIGNAVIFNFVLYLISYIYNFKFLKIGTDKIIYNKGIKNIKELKYDEISKAKKDSFGNIMLYKGNKLVIVIPSSAMLAEQFLKIHNISFEDESADIFIMKETVFYKGLSIVIVICFVLFLILSIYTKVTYCIIFFGIILFISIIDCIKKVSKKIVVSKKTISISGILIKNKEISLSKITHIERKTVNNADVIILYSVNGRELKISKLYKNAYLFEDIIKKYHWK